MFGITSAFYTFCSANNFGYHLCAFSTESHDNPFLADGELQRKADYILQHSRISRNRLEIVDPDTPVHKTRDHVTDLKRQDAFQFDDRVDDHVKQCSCDVNFDDVKRTEDHDVILKNGDDLSECGKTIGAKLASYDDDVIRDDVIVVTRDVVKRMHLNDVISAESKRNLERSVRGFDEEVLDRNRYVTNIDDVITVYCNNNTAENRKSVNGDENSFRFRHGPSLVAHETAVTASAAAYRNGSRTTSGTRVTTRPDADHFAIATIKPAPSYDITSRNGCAVMTTTDVATDKRSLGAKKTTDDVSKILQSDVENDGIGTMSSTIHKTGRSKLDDVIMTNDVTAATEYHSTSYGFSFVDVSKFNDEPFLRTSQLSYDAAPISDITTKVSTRFNQPNDVITLPPSVYTRHTSYGDVTNNCATSTSFRAHNGSEYLRNFAGIHSTTACLVLPTDPVPIVQLPVKPSIPERHKSLPPLAPARSSSRADGLPPGPDNDSVAIDAASVTPTIRKDDDIIAESRSGVKDETVKRKRQCCQLQ